METEIQQASYECCILGTGPAGMGAALELVRSGIRSVILIDRNKTVGGLARTEIFDGNRFDVGPHRFYTKNDEIRRLWNATLGADFRPVNRITRILYGKKLFKYPLDPFDSLRKLGLFKSITALSSFGMSRFGRGNPKNFEDWVVQKFGYKLYETFFKTYTEKVWGIPCREIGAEWATQRIKGLDLSEILRNAFRPNGANGPRTLVDRFHYPVLGAGQMYGAMAQQVSDGGVEILLNSRVTAFHRKDDLITSVDVATADGRRLRVSARQFFNSIPITHFIKLLDPPPTDAALHAASALYYRDHITVNLVIDHPNLFPDQWIYVHSPDVRMARVANYKNFSGQMTQSSAHSGLSVEYFAFQNDPLWQESDETIKQLAIDELRYTGLAQPHMVRQSWVVRETESYPAYYLGFQEPYNVIRSAMDGFKNVYPIGRGGLYRYNNQDHASISGILAARNYLRRTAEPYNLWNINIDAEYVESGAHNADGG